MGGIAFHTFDSGKPGPNLLVMGLVHGLEPAGEIGSYEIIRQINSGMIDVRAGSVTFIPACNPEARALGQRQVDENLNRVFQFHANPETHEQRRANEILPFLDAADAHLDLHSTFKPPVGGPFTICATKDYGSPDLVRMMGTNVGVIADRSAAAADRPSWTSTTYATFKDKPTPAVTLECGQHEDPNAPKVAMQGIMNFLGGYGVIDYTPKPIGDNPMEMLDVRRIYYNDEIERYVDDVTPPAMSRYQKGDLIAFFKDGTPILAEANNTTLLMPNGGVNDGQVPRSAQFYRAEPVNPVTLEALEL